MKTACFGYLFAMMVFLFPAGTDAATIEAASCEEQDVQDAVDQAVDGDTVVIPAGQCIWETANGGAPPVSISEKKITLRGAGAGRTVITGATSSGQGETGLQVRLAQGKPVRITGITFNLTANPMININGTARDWRIDNCRFSIADSKRVAVYIYQQSYGLIDHCSFVNCGVVVVFGLGHDSWQQPLSLGTRDAVYIEECDFSKTIDDVKNCVDSNGGGRYVFRHNTASDVYCEAHSLQNAWSDGSFQRGTRSYEIYGNTFYATNQAGVNFLAVRLRSGTGVVFDNKVINNADAKDNFNGFCGLDNVRSIEPMAYLLTECDGNNDLDGNTPGMAGWPCRDQIGRSTDSTDNPVAPNLTQQDEPLYLWNNTMDGEPVNAQVINDVNNRNHILKTRDYIEDGTPKPGYSSFTFPHPLAEGETNPPPDPDTGSSGGGGGCFIQSVRTPECPRQ